MSWIDTASAIPVAEVAAKLGYEVRRATSAQHCPCPACGAERRHTKSRDRRGAVGLPKSKPTVWKCWQCEAGGDAIDFVACRLHGARFRDLADHQKAEVRDWFGVDPFALSKPIQRRQERPAHVAWENAECIYPPIRELEALWDMCEPINRDAQAQAYLAHRGIAPDLLAEHDCVRALPERVVCPEWACVGDRAWTATHHRLLVPLYDWQGTMRSVIARSVELRPALKSAGAKGYQRRGLVMAGTYGLQMLTIGNRESLHRLENFRLAVYEGEINFLRGVSKGADREISENFQPAAFVGVLGIFSGSFTRDIASRVPSRSTVHMRTDDDDQGHKYAEAIRGLLGERVAYAYEYEPDDSPAKGAA